MKRRTKQILSLFLSTLITFSSVLGSYAENLSIDNKDIVESEHNDKSYFDFGASEYEIPEDKSQFDIKVLRHGNLEGDVDVSFKIADFIASYGVDYVVLDENNQPLDKVNGNKPKLSDFVQDDEDENISDEIKPEEKDSQKEDDKENKEELLPNEEVIPYTSQNDEVYDEKLKENLIDEETLSVEKENNEQYENQSQEQIKQETQQEETNKENINEKSQDSSNIDGKTEKPSEKQPEVSDNENDTEKQPEVSDDKNDTEKQEKNIKDNDIQESEDKIADVPHAKKKVSTGSPLIDAYNSYLNIENVQEEKEEKQETETAIGDTFNDMYKYFLSAEGAKGVLHFKSGESEKIIRIKINDNKVSSSDKLFMIALMGTNSDLAMIAANATTYVTIKDNEEYETPSFEIVEDELTLSKDEPQKYITIKKTSGEQYFSNIKISTIKQTALDRSYDNFEDKVIGFVPGETEKKVKIKAYNFSEESEFGVIIEEDNGINISKNYITVNIQKDEESVENQEQFADVIPVNSQKDSVVLGISKTQYELNQIPGGWNNDVKELGGSHYDKAIWTNNGRNLFLTAYTKNVGVAWVTNKKMNFTGIKNVDFKIFTTGDGEGTRYNTWFEIDRYRSFFGIGKSYSIMGRSAGWMNQTLNTSGANGDYYIKFKTRPLQAGRHNPQASLSGPLVFHWSRYKFITENSVEDFTRNIYDFSEGTPKIYPTYFDGEKEISFNPGTVEIKSDEKNLEAFYANNEKSITISAINKDKNEKNGIYLKGVYFALNTKNSSDLYDKYKKKYNTNNTYYVSANKSTHEITISPNQDFIKNLLNNSALPENSTGDFIIKVFPVFEQKLVSVNFENTDRDDSNVEKRGKFDENNKNSYITNILEAHKKGFLAKYVYQGWMDYYSARIPQYSIVRVKAVAKSDRSISGIRYWHWDKEPKIAYYKAGDKKFSGTNPDKDDIKETDYTKADIVADDNLSMAPATGKQTFYIGYSPITHKFLEEHLKNLKNTVVNTTPGDKGEATDESGSMYLQNPYIGKDYTLSVFAPEGYYTSWINMTGDKNNDGVVDFEEGNAPSVRNTQNPIELYGNKLKVKLDQNDTRYYYEFRKKVGNTGLKKKGTVLREKNTFYNLVNGISSRQQEPIVGAFLDVAGFRGQTDGKGNYSIDLNGLPAWGQAGVSLNVAGKEYNKTVRLERELETKLPAFEEFKAKAISANYNKKASSVKDNYITIQNDELTFNIIVEPLSLLRPEKVKFFIYDDNGYQVLDTSTKKNVYNVEVLGPIGINNQYRIKLKFNPKVDMKLGYKLYVQFADQNNTWYPKIDTGYEFFKELDLKEFTFPLLGSSSIEKVYKSGFVTDIIGDPLGDLSLGSISGFETSGEKYTPQGIPEDDIPNNTWYRHDYKFGWSTSIGRTKSWQGNNNQPEANKNEKDGNSNNSSPKKENSNTTVEKEQKEVLKKLKTGEISGKPTSESKYSTKGSFSWRVNPSVGFKLTLSTRKDGKQYFEDLAFYVKAGFNVRSLNTITLPIGLNIVIGANLSGDVTGVYYMYTDYGQDPYERKTVPYTTKDFGVFKEFNNNIRREGYLFLNPKIGVSLGAGYGIVSVSGTANFDFDMDFKFKEKDSFAYGDVTIDLGWKISLVGFDVYSKKLVKDTQHLFNTAGQNGHIDFDFKKVTAETYKTAMDYLAIDEEDTLVLDRPIAKSYHFNGESEWNGKMISASIDNSSETIEVPVLSNAGDDLKVRLAKLSGSRILMVYIGYDQKRNDVNKRALYYSIGQGDSWSEPKLLDDDQTLDDYPDIQDLGDKLIISWSSADKVFEEGSKVEDVLKSLNIKTVFFDKKKDQPEKVIQLTKTTSEDFTSDVFPRAAYDPHSKQLVLYYTKTEYNNIRTFKDILTAESVTAYLMYDENTDKWNNTEDEYRDDEYFLASKTQEYRENYRKNWYGQRFLDLRLDKTKDELVRISETAAISYNKLALFAWTVDGDKNLNTHNDRDVFMQIYDFEKDKFTHIIRITENSGIYSTPKFARSGKTTYLFFGSKDEKSEHGNINYLDISDIVFNEKYQKVNNNNNSEYYELKENIEARNINLREKGNFTIPAETLWIKPYVATASNNINDYDVHVTDDGHMYLLWTDTVTENGEVSRQIMASMYDGSLETKDTKDSDMASWSEPFVITNAKAGEYYKGIGASVLGNDIYIGAEKGSYNNQNYYSQEGEVSQNSNKPSTLVIAKHRPSSKLEVIGITIDEEELNEGNNRVKVIAMIKNQGLLPKEGGDTINFTMDGNTFESMKFVVSDSENGEYKDIIPGAKIVEVSAYATLKDGIEDDIIFGVNINGSNELTVDKNFEAKDKINLVEDSIKYLEQYDYIQGKYIYNAMIENKGKNATGKIRFELFAGDEKIAEKTIDTLENGEVGEVEIPFDLKDSLYEINEGLGQADINIVASSSYGYFMDEEKTVERQFDEKYISLLEKVKVKDIKYDLKIGTTKDIQPAMQGVQDRELVVEWLSSSDDSIASINSSNHIVANKEGRVQLKGMVVPNKEKMEIDSLGNSYIKDWKYLAPSDKLIYVTADVDVYDKISLDNSKGSKDNKPENRIKNYQKDKKQEKVKSEYISKFKDVSTKNWFYAPIKYVLEKGLFKGTSENEFSPNANLTRAMLVTVLYRAEGMPEIKSKNNFEDVSDNQYYSLAVLWAKENGIVFGQTDTKFNPKANITREEMAQIIFRYSKLKGINSKEKTNLNYKDLDSISNWSVEGIEFCKENNIMIGNEKNEFKAKDNTTRAEAAAGLQKLLEDVIQAN